MQELNKMGWLGPPLADTLAAGHTQQVGHTAQSAKRSQQVPPLPSTLLCLLLVPHPVGSSSSRLHMCIQMANTEQKSSSWLYRGLASHDADSSDASSQDNYNSSTSYALNGRRA